ncbi:hypothetical protein Mtc_0703 [Methanocella conradii HZ254]|uniref:Uncharacterized protein n=1 Tax=Methanocella conradii (strain DSM 24694 / JCM 17849 / CGMCC 1.5162 / HZ254) TaxID=1041930 RepID=H8I8J1_METCZ|nr:hypothetical protein [Methanocella conradii]AFC99467.1 hypothetical protein Mtc_0703 [Methanocella conradii HZ254]MDI6897886.1 hypothetical protein [Methanocella conradii]
MNEWLQKHFLSMLSLIALLLIVILASIIIWNPSKIADDNQLPKGANASGVGSFTFTPVDSFNLSLTSNVTSDGLSDVNTSMPFNVPVYREVVIVYFKEMPVSVGEFASSYGVSPVFVKGDIRMAAFESDPVMVGGVVSEKTALAIERISKDPRVESVKRDTYMFVDPRQEIDMTPRLIYPEDLEKKGVEVIPDRVCVGFWRLPPSLDEFGEKYGGKPIDLTETNLRLQWVSYETKDVKGFIDRASKDPYVQYIEVHGKGQWATIPNGT